MDFLVEMVMGAGGLGLAAFGVVEGFKWTPLGIAGFRRVKKALGPGARRALANCYGSDYKIILREQYRDGRASGAAKSIIRQGLRIGLDYDNAEDLAHEIGVVSADQLRELARKFAKGDDLDDTDLRILGRLELAFDARLDAAFAAGETYYRAMTRLTAGVVALGTAIVVALVLKSEGLDDQYLMLRAVIVGVVAVPLAPVFKDLAGALTSARRAIRKV
jgi:hypothetical protein